MRVSQDITTCYVIKLFYLTLIPSMDFPLPPYPLYQAKPLHPFQLPMWEGISICPPLGMLSIPAPYPLLPPLFTRSSPSIPSGFPCGRVFLYVPHLACYLYLPPTPSYPLSLPDQAPPSLPMWEGISMCPILGM